ncbi:hypothetical protein AgCh_017046 [Apium graveolens]
MAPAAGEYKVNVDASWFQGAESFSIGMVMRNHLGNFIEGRTVTLYQAADALEAEVLGIREALSWVKNMDDRKVIENDVVITKSRTYAKEPEDFTPAEKEEASLDASLQLTLIDSLDPLMNRHVMNYKNSKHMWETIEVINEGTEEVRKNKLEILTSEYEHFKSNPGEGITEVFERYNALINNLNINDKYYSIREVNKKFLLTLPTHLEHRIIAIREARDLSEISLDRLYGVLKTYELEQIQ